MAEKSNPTLYQIKVALVGSEPHIWRRLLVAANMTLSTLHGVLQIAMGWEDSHLHQFAAGGQSYGVPDPELPLDMKNEARVKVKDLLPGKGASAVYEYDFGDGWEHELVVEQVLSAEENGPAPRCPEGERACPPEDCGGIYGYEHLLEVVADPKHEEHEDLIEWLGGKCDPEHFDASVINFQLGRTFGRRA